MAGDSNSGFPLNKKRAVLTGLSAVVLAAVVIFFIGRVASFHKMVKALSAADGWWFVLCVLGETAAYTGYIFAYRDFARASRGPRLSWWLAVRVIGIGFGANVAGSTAAGLAVDYWALQAAGARTHESARRVLALNTMEWVALSAMTVAAAIAVLAGAGAGAPVYLALIWLVVVPACFAGGYWFTSQPRVSRFSKLPEAPGAPFEWSPRLWRNWAVTNFRRLFADAIGSTALVRHVIGRPLAYRAGNTGFFIYWLGDMACLYGATLALGYYLGPAALVLAYATTYLITMLPLPAGGAGGFEAAMTYVLHLVGLPLHIALLSALIFRFFTFWLPLVPALALMPTLKSLKAELSKSRRDWRTPKLNGIPL